MGSCPSILNTETIAEPKETKNRKILLKLLKISSCEQLWAFPKILSVKTGQWRHHKTLVSCVKRQLQPCLAEQKFYF